MFLAVLLLVFYYILLYIASAVRTFHSFKY